jgi:hypothetical protein
MSGAIAGIDPSILDDVEDDDDRSVQPLPALPRTYWSVA